MISKYPIFVSLTICNNCNILSYAESMHLSCPMCGKMKPPGNTTAPLNRIFYKINKDDNIVKKGEDSKGKPIMNRIVSLKTLTAKELVYVGQQVKYA